MAIRDASRRTHEVALRHPPVGGRRLAGRRRRVCVRCVIV
jgi:hypothetical protein